jgi:hypothetical protein
MDAKLRDTIRQDGDRVLLSFSTGKDSLAAWLVLRDAGFKVTPFYMQLIPDLQFVERSLRYYEDFFGVHIYRTLHPSFAVYFLNLWLQPPHRKEAIDRIGFYEFDYGDVEYDVKRTAGLPETAWTAVGLRRAESLARRSRIPQCGYSAALRKFYPVAEYTKDDLIRVLRKANVKLPVDYTLFGRSFDGLDYQYLRPIRDKFPEDYRRILKWHPLAGAEFHREDVANSHGQNVSDTLFKRYDRKTGNIEADDAAETRLARNAFKRVDDMHRKIVDADYCLHLVFVTADQRDAFVRALGIAGCSPDDTYFDGLKVAEKLGVEIAPDPIPFRKRTPDRRLINEVGLIPEEE